MTAVPRALFALAIVALSLVPLPTVAAGDCVEVNTTTFSEGMRIIANAGRQIALGFRSSEPGDGLGFLVVITPAVCSGFGVGGLELSGLDATNVDPDETQGFLLGQVPTALPLP